MALFQRQACKIVRCVWAVWAKHTRGLQPFILESDVLDLSPSTVKWCSPNGRFLQPSFTVLKCNGLIEENSGGNFHKNTYRFLYGRVPMVNIGTATDPNNAQRYVYCKRGLYTVREVHILWGLRREVWYRDTGTDTDTGFRNTSLLTARITITHDTRRATGVSERSWQDLDGTEQMIPILRDTQSGRVLSTFL